MIEIVKATSKPNFVLIEQLAQTIWHEHYPAIISVEQIDYMLAKYNSIEAIVSQINDGYQFYYMTYKGVPAGYIAIKIHTDHLYVSKLYVLKELRGNKIAKAAMLFVESIVEKEGISVVKLHVNKYNSNSILAYEKLGFKKIKATITDIGKGFIMDDYLLKKEI